MKLGMIGYPQAGKRTLLEALTGRGAGSNGGKNGGLGLARVRDERFEHLVDLYRPRRETPLHIEFELLPDLEEQAARNGATLRQLETVDVICLVVRAFQDPNVFHVLGGVDPARDLLRFHEELQLNDMLFAEKRVERLEKERGRKGDARKSAEERDLLARMAGHLEAGLPLRTLALTQEEEKCIAGYALLTRKPLMVILNGEEEDPEQGPRMDRLAEAFEPQAFQWIGVSARIEREISLLDPGEREEFMAALGIRRPALDRLTTLCYRTLGLVSFFTVGSDEVRAWAVHRGSAAPRAARAIHSDMERGFIRAEVMKYRDLAASGSEQRLKLAGKVMQKGKDYVVEDGDIISFLFNV